MAGTIAEEMVYADISTGAHNDLERATAIARNMVMEYGMSALGRINYRGTQRPAFLAVPGMDDATRGYSEKTAREIDEQVRRIIENAIEHVRDILQTRRPALEALAKRLIEVESVNADDLKRIIDASSPGPQVVPGTVGTPRVSLGKEPVDNAAEATGEA
jgi:cell division protease FtsH